MDIGDKAQNASIFEHEDFDLIINAAAYTAVDKAESDRETAFQVNADGVEHLANLAKQHAIPLFHISTDYVFDGETTVAYKETATDESPDGIRRIKTCRESSDSRETAGGAYHSKNQLGLWHQTAIIS